MTERLKLSEALKARSDASHVYVQAYAELRTATGLFERGQLTAEQAQEAMANARTAKQEFHDANTRVVETLNAGGIGPLAQYEGVAIFGADEPDMPNDAAPWFENGAVRYFISQPIYLKPKERGLKKHPPDFDLARAVLIAVDSERYPNVESALNTIFPDGDPETNTGARQTTQAEADRKRIRRRVNDLVGKTPGGWSRR